MGGGWLATEKAEVGVVFPVKTELQHVRGEGFSDGYAEKTEFQKNKQGFGAGSASHTHARRFLVSIQTGRRLLIL